MEADHIYFKKLTFIFIKVIDNKKIEMQDISFPF